VKRDPKTKEIEAVQSAVCAAFGITREELFEKRKSENKSLARIASIAICREFASQVSVGVAHERHATATIYSIRKFPGYIETIPHFREKVLRVRAILKP
jgi:chromosomal replication initiation ATPase DnaA